MKKYRYLISYNFAKKEFSPELNREITNNGFGDTSVTIRGKLTYSKINEIRENIAKINGFSIVVILNVIRLEKVED